jgi:hypothetical protein
MRRHLKLAGNRGHSSIEGTYMKHQRLAVKAFAMLAASSIIAVGAVVAPAQADTGWNRQVGPARTTAPVGATGVGVSVALSSGRP